MFQRFFVLLSLILLLNVQAYSNELSDIDIHAFASTGFIISDKYNYLTQSIEGTCEFNEAGINFSSLITDDIQIGLQIYSYDLGNVSNNIIKLDWAMIDYSWKETLGIRLGKFKTPLALYTDIIDYDMLYTPAILPQGIYSLYLRESIKSVQGMNLYGKINMGTPGIVGYDLYYGTVSIDKDGSLPKMFTGEDGVFQYSEVKNLLGTRIKWNTFIKGLGFVISYLQSDFMFQINNQGVKSTIEYSQAALKILSAEYSIGNLNASFEYQISTGNVFTEIDMTNIVGIPTINKLESEIDVDSYYGQVSYRFCRWFETGLYYSVNNAEKMDPTINKPDYADWQKDMALCTRFDINDFWLMKFEVHQLNGVGQVLDILQPEEYKGKNWTAFVFKTTFSF